MLLAFLGVALVYMLWYRFSPSGRRWCTVCGKYTGQWIGWINRQYVGPHCFECAQERIFRISQRGGISR